MHMLAPCWANGSRVRSEMMVSQTDWGSPEIRLNFSVQTERGFTITREETGIGWPGLSNG